MPAGFGVSFSSLGVEEAPESGSELSRLFMGLPGVVFFNIPGLQGIV